MSLYGKNRDILLINSINRELLGRIINQQIGYYKINLDSTKTNLYGESTEKFYYSPVIINCLINAGDSTTEDNDFGPDSFRNVSFAMFRQDLIDANLEPENGDIIMWNENYYEVHNTSENQLFVGKNPDYSISQYTQNFGSSISVMVETHWTRIDKLNIAKSRL